MSGLKIDYETADRIAVTVMKDQLRYLEQEQEWFESGDVKKKELEKKWGFSIFVHPEDYSKNASEYIPALKTLIKYFGG